jgi:hypothetical protein
MSRHRFKVGQLVYCSSRESGSGFYEVKQLLPPEGDVFHIELKTPQSRTNAWLRSMTSPARSSQNYGYGLRLSGHRGEADGPWAHQYLRFPYR